MLRRHDADDDLRAVERGVQIVGRRDRFWQDESRQKAFVDSTPSDALTNFRLISPQPDFVPQIARRFAPQNNRQPRSPRASSDMAMRLICRLLLTCPTLLLTPFQTL